MQTSHKSKLPDQETLRNLDWKLFISMTIKSMKLHLESIKFRELSFLFSPQHHAPEVMENNKQNKRLNIPGL